MKHHEIEDIIKKKFEKINVGLESVRLHFHEDDIRLLRVKVKKLGAWLRLMDAAKGHHQALKIPQSIIRYYEVAGKVRSSQLQQLYVQKTLDANQMALAETYLTLVSDKILQHISFASQMLKGDEPFKRAEGFLVKALPDHLSSKMTEQFVWTEIKQLKQLLIPVFPTDQSLHEIRKLLKGLLYVWPAVQNMVGQISPYALLSNEENINAFTIVLGKFHDINSAIDLLHSGCLNMDVAESEKAVLRIMESLWIKEKEAARQDIYLHMQQIINSRQPTHQLINSAVL